MSNPILPAGVAVQAFSSVVVSLPETSLGRGRDRISAGIEQLREETRVAASKLGFTDGHAEGFETGYEEGLQRGREVAAREAELVGEALALEIGALHERIQAEWNTFLLNSEAALVDQSLATVKALLGVELKTSRESTLEIVHQCLGEVVNATSIRIRVAAEDLPNLLEHLKDDRVELIADGSIGAGCIIESSAGTVDGTVETSLRLLQSAWDEAA